MTLKEFVWTVEYTFPRAVAGSILYAAAIIFFPIILICADFLTAPYKFIFFSLLITIGILLLHRLYRSQRETYIELFRMLRKLQAEEERRELLKKLVRQ